MTLYEYMAHWVAAVVADPEIDFDETLAWIAQYAAQQAVTAGKKDAP